MKSETQTSVTRATVLIFASIFVTSLVTVLPLGATLVRAQKPTAAAAGPGTGARMSQPTDMARAHPFESGEELIYVAEFSRALLKKVDVADFRFTAIKQPGLRKIVEAGFGQDTGGAAYSLKFTGDISSKGFFSKLFNLRFREQIESIVEPAPFSVKKTKRVDEQGKRARISETTYSNGNLFWIERDPNNPSRPPRSAETAFAGQVQDVLSAIYFLRTQPLEIGKTIEVTISDSGRVYQVPVRAVEKKRMKTILGRIEVLRVDAEVYGPNRIIDGEGQFSIWFTTDMKRIPVSARVKTEYGTFDITLRKIIQNPTQPQYLTRATNGH
jgi:hypothetical protein